MKNIGRVSKKKALEIINEELEKGKVYSEVIGVVRSYGTIAESSFALYWKQANEAYDAERQRLQAIREQAAADATAAAAAKANILTKAQRQEIASKIARGEAWRVGDVMMMPNASERIRALDYLSKMDGDFAAIKTENEVTLNQIDVENLTPAQEEEILKLGNTLFLNQK